MWFHLCLLDEADGMDTLEDDILSSPPQQPPPAPPPEVLEELAAIEAMEAMDDSPIQNGYSYDDAFTEESPITKPPNVCCRIFISVLIVRLKGSATKATGV
nr:unnamed protein product [Callosobruchus analis]